MNLDDKFNLFVKELSPIDSKVIKPKGRNKEYWIKLAAHTICNWCWFEERYLNEHTIEELVDKYKQIKDLKQKEQDGM